MTRVVYKVKPLLSPLNMMWLLIELYNKKTIKLTTITNLVDLRNTNITCDARCHKKGSCSGISRYKHQQWLCPQHQPVRSTPQPRPVQDTRTKPSSTCYKFKLTIREGAARLVCSARHWIVMQCATKARNAVTWQGTRRTTSIRWILGHVRVTVKALPNPRQKPHQLRR